MQITTAFPSEFLRAADLQGRQIEVVMDRVEMKEIGGDQKPVLYFEGKQRGLVLNKTNAGTISDTYGDETEGWAGEHVIIYPAETDYQGKRVPCIRVKVPRPQSRVAEPQRAVAPPQAPPNSASINIEDEIPF